MARLEIELAFYDFTVQRFNHYATRTPPKKKVNGWKIYILCSWLYIIYLFIDLFYFCQHVSILKFAWTQKHSIKNYFKYENKNRISIKENFFDASPKSSSGLNVWFCEDEQHTEIYSKLITLCDGFFFLKKVASFYGLRTNL